MDIRELVESIKDISGNKGREILAPIHTGQGPRPMPQSAATLPPGISPEFSRQFDSNKQKRSAEYDDQAQLKRLLELQAQQKASGSWQQPGPPDLPPQQQQQQQPPQQPPGLSSPGQGGPPQQPPMMNNMEGERLPIPPQPGQPPPMMSLMNDPRLNEEEKMKAIWLADQKAKEDRISRARAEKYSTIALGSNPIHGYRDVSGFASIAGAGKRSRGR